jgi:CheY-like chemotaxis protein
MKPNLRIAPRSHARILVVDDEKFLVELLADLLEDEGYVVERAHDGAQALQMIESDLPDLVLTDVMMPRMNGTELLAAVRRRLPAWQLPFVLFSAGTPPDIRWENVSFMAKPVHIEQIVSEVRHMLAGCLTADFEASTDRGERSA